MNGNRNIWGSIHIHELNTDKSTFLTPCFYKIFKVFIKTVFFYVI